jgi:hypothetical protein
LVVHATQAFAAASVAIVSDVAAGHRAAAQADELRAQAAYDVFRPDLATGLGPSAPLDALVVDQDPAVAARGLHALERELWSGSLSAAAPLARDVASQGTLIEVSLFRTVVTPSVMCQRVAESLAWLVANVIASPQERYSHLDVVDVRATIGAAESAVAGVATLARLVAPRDGVALAAAMTRLVEVSQEVASTVRDSAVPPGWWRTLASALDATLTPLAQMSGALAGYGTGRAYA